MGSGRPGTALPRQPRRFRPPRRDHPGGHANLLATTSVSQNLAEALDFALTGPCRPLDLGRINGEHFAVMAGVGFDPELMDDVDGKMKSRLGRLAYFWTGLRHIPRAASPVKITVDGRSWFDGMASCVLLGNVGGLRAGFRHSDDAHPDDGWLEVGVATANGPLQWARALGESSRAAPTTLPSCA